MIGADGAGEYKSAAQEGQVGVGSAAVAAPAEQETGIAELPDEVFVREWVERCRLSLDPENPNGDDFCAIMERLDARLQAHRLPGYEQLTPSRVLTEFLRLVELYMEVKDEPGFRLKGGEVLATTLHTAVFELVHLYLNEHMTLTSADRSQYEALVQKLGECFRSDENSKLTFELACANAGLDAVTEKDEPLLEVLKELNATRVDAGNFATLLDATGRILQRSSAWYGKVYLMRGYTHVASNEQLVGLQRLVSSYRQDGDWRIKFMVVQAIADAILWTDDPTRRHRLLLSDDKEKPGFFYFSALYRTKKAHRLVTDETWRYSTAFQLIRLTRQLPQEAGGRVASDFLVRLHAREREHGGSSLIQGLFERNMDLLVQNVANRRVDCQEKELDIPECLADCNACRWLLATTAVKEWSIERRNRLLGHMQDSLLDDIEGFIVREVAKDVSGSEADIKEGLSKELSLFAARSTYALKTAIREIVKAREGVGQGTDYMEWGAAQFVGKTLFVRDPDHVNPVHGVVESAEVDQRRGWILLKMVDGTQVELIHANGRLRTIRKGVERRRPLEEFLLGLGLRAVSGCHVASPSHLSVGGVRLDGVYSIRGEVRHNVIPVHPVHASSEGLAGGAMQSSASDGGSQASSPKSWFERVKDAFGLSSSAGNMEGGQNVASVPAPSPQGRTAHCFHLTKSDEPQASLPLELRFFMDAEESQPLLVEVVVPGERRATRLMRSDLSACRVVSTEWQPIMLESRGRQVKITRQPDDRNAQKRRNAEAAERSKRKLLREMTRLENRPLLDRALDCWTAADCQTLTGGQVEELFTDHTTLFDLLQRVSSFYKEAEQELDEEAAERVYGIGSLFTEFVMEANNISLLQRGKDGENLTDDLETGGQGTDGASLSKMVRVMDLLRETFDSISDLEGKELILFFGDTGAGKSSAVNEYAGIPQKYGSNDVGWKVIEIDDARMRERGIDPSACAVIGQSIGISQTAILRGHRIVDADELERFDNPDLRLSDCPGFNDTREDIRDLVTNLSIARAVEKAKSVRAVVLVIDYRSFLPARATPVVKAFDNFDTYLTNMQKEKDGRGSVYVLITRYAEYKGAEDRFAALLERLYEEQAAELEKEAGSGGLGARSGAVVQGMRRLEIWQTLKILYANDRVAFMDIEDPDQRAQFLTEFSTASTGQRLDREDDFTKTMDHFEVAQLFRNAVVTMTYRWRRHVLERYQATLPEEIERTRKEAKAIKVELLEHRKRVRKLREKLSVDGRKLLSTQAKRTNWQEKLDQPELRAEGLDEEARTENVRSREAVLRSKRARVEDVDERLRAKRESLQVVQSRIAELQEDIRKAKRDNETDKSNIEDMIDGDEEILLWEYKHEPGTEMTIWTAKDGVIDAAFDARRGYDLSTDAVEGSVRKVQVDDFEGKLYPQAVLSRDYRILPPGAGIDSLESRRVENGRYVIPAEDSEGDSYLAEVRGVNFRPHKGRNPDEEGKKVQYSFEVRWLNKAEHPNRELPHIEITHTVQNKVIHEGDIGNLRSSIAEREGQLQELGGELNGSGEAKGKLEERGELTAEVQALEAELKQLKDEVSSADASLREGVEGVIRGVITNLDAEVTGLESAIARAEQELDASPQVIEHLCQEGRAKRMRLRQKQGERLRLAVLISSRWSTLERLNEIAELVVDSGRGDESDNLYRKPKQRCQEYMDFLHQYGGEIKAEVQSDLASGLSISKLVDSVATAADEIDAGVEADALDGDLEHKDADDHGDGPGTGEHKQGAPEGDGAAEGEDPAEETAGDAPADLEEDRGLGVYTFFVDPARPLPDPSGAGGDELPPSPPPAEAADAKESSAAQAQAPEAMQEAQAQSAAAADAVPPVAPPPEDTQEVGEEPAAEVEPAANDDDDISVVSVTSGGSGRPG